MQATHIADKTELIFPYFVSFETTTEQRLVLEYEKYMEFKKCPNSHNLVKIKMQEEFDRFVDSIKICRQVLTKDNEYMYKCDDYELEARNE